ncbi:Bacterial regulatory protein, luxR family [compost metagenome]
MEIALVELYLNVIKEGVFKNCPKRRRNALYEQFAAYGLTPREKQIAYNWALNRGGLQIAEMLGITESTVRSAIKIIYRKIGVSDKGQFLRLFL